MSMPVAPCGYPVNITATGNVTAAASKGCQLIGFYVCSTTSGTLVLRKDGSGGTVISGTITPAIGFHWFPADVSGTLHATIGGSALDLTFFFSSAN